MKPSRWRGHRFLVLAFGVLLVTGLVTPAVGNADATLGITGLQVQGDTVHVTLTNAGDDSVSAIVTLSVTLETGGADASVYVDVRGGQTAFVAIVFPSKVEEILDCGEILDDAPPF